MGNNDGVWEGSLPAGFRGKALLTVPGLSGAPRSQRQMWMWTLQEQKKLIKQKKLMKQTNT